MLPQEKVSHIDGDCGMGEGLRATGSRNMQDTQLIIVNESCMNTVLAAAHTCQWLIDLQESHSLCLTQQQDLSD